MSVTKADLDFQPCDPGGGAPAMPCNYCGQTKKPEHMATLQIDHDASFSFVVCSEACRDNFMKAPASQLDGYINQCIDQARTLHGL